MANISKDERERRASVLETSNPREPTPPTSDQRDEPITDAAGGFPTGTPGTAEPSPLTDPVKKAELVAKAAAYVPMFPVILKRGYYPMDGSAKLAEGKKVELPIEEARRLIESGIAARADALPEV